MLDIRKYDPDIGLEMFDSVVNFLSGMKVHEDNNFVYIDGIPGREFSNDIYKIWRSSKIADNLFYRARGSSLQFYKFFAPEILYTLQVTQASRRGWVNKRTIAKAIDELLADSWLKNTQIVHPNILDFSKLQELNVKLLPHQQEFLEQYNTNVPRYGLNGYLLAAPPGAGKTINGLALMHCTDVDIVITIAPNNSLYKVWKKTITGSMETISLEAIDDSEEIEVSLESLISNHLFKEPKKCWVSQDKKPFDLTCSHFVFHYESLEEALALVETIQEQMPYKKIGIILDECHNFNEIKSKRTELFLKLCKKANSKHVIWASGTPIKAIGNEAIPLLKSIDPLFTDAVEASFKTIFGKSATKGLDILQNRMGLISYKVSKDVVREKGKPIVIPVRVKLDPKVAERFTLDYIKNEMVEFVTERLKFYQSNFKHFENEYLRCLAIYHKTLDSKEEEKAFDKYRDYIKIIRKYYDPVQHKEQAMYCNKFEDEKIIPSLSNADKHIFRECKSVVKYVYLKVQGEALGRILGKRRAECNTELVKHCGLEKIISDSEKKTVIFSSWVETIKEAEEYVIDKGFEPVMVYGGTNKEVTEIVTRFENNPNINPIIATYQSLSTAVPLVVANTVVLLNQPFRDHEWDQAVARVDRLGQDTQVYVFEVLLDTGVEPNISTRSKDILEWSKNQILAIMGKDTPANIDDMLIANFAGDNSAFNMASNVLSLLVQKATGALGKLSKYL